MKTNYHTHTTRCMHAVGDDEDYVRSAIKGGFQELGFSDHGPWKYHTDFVSDIRMLPEDLPEYIESIRALKEKYRNQISIKIGLEYEYFLKEQLRNQNISFISEATARLEGLSKTPDVVLQFPVSINTDKYP